MNNIYSISSYKSFIGHEGYGFNCHLLENNVKVAFVINEGDGGCHSWQWMDKDARQRYFDHLATLPERLEHPIEFHDHFINVMIDKFEFDKKLKKLCKKSTVFTIKDQDRNYYRTLNIEYIVPNIDRIVAYLNDKFGIGNFEIINQQFCK